MTYRLVLLALSALFMTPSWSAPLTLEFPQCSSVTLSGNTVTCTPTGTTPPPSTCPPGQIGTPPNCTVPPTEQCPPGQVGTPPNCTTPPPTAGLENCTQHGLSVLGGSAKELSFTAASGGQSGTGFNDTNAWVFKLTVPAGTPQTSRVGQFQVAEYSSQPTSRFLVISKVPCDFFRPMDAYGATGPINLSRNGTTASTNFQVGQPANPTQAGMMTAGETYYFSVRNYSDYPLPNGSPSCGAGNQCQATYNYQTTAAQTATKAKKPMKKPKPKKVTPK